jgi:hypothetical protein
MPRSAKRSRPCGVNTIKARAATVLASGTRQTQQTMPNFQMGRSIGESQEIMLAPNPLFVFACLGGRNLE